MKFLNKKQAGDTIIEVLIALSVLTFALSMGYATANRSSKAIQANKERYQAQLIANAQAENIRAYIGTVRLTLNSGTNCMNNNIVNSSPENCMANSNGVISSDPDSRLYTVSVSCVSVGSCVGNYSNYKISVTWPSLSGGQDNVELYYGI